MAEPGVGTAPATPPPGWYPDPAGLALLRYWTGTGWSQWLSDGRGRTLDPSATPHPVDTPREESPVLATQTEPTDATSLAAEPAAGRRRWDAKPPSGLRLLGGPGPPIAAAAAFGVAWNIVSGWPQAPRGDVNFAWMPLLAIEVAIVGGLLGLLALATRSATQLLTVSAILWTLASVPIFLLLPGYGTREGFPTTSIPLMALCGAISLTPTLLVWSWARSGDQSTTSTPNRSHS